MLQEYLDLYEERAAIIQFDANIDKVVAEKRAFYETINYFCSKNNLTKTDTKTAIFSKELRNNIN